MKGNATQLFQKCCELVLIAYIQIGSRWENTSLFGLSEIVHAQSFIKTFSSIYLKTRKGPWYLGVWLWQILASQMEQLKYPLCACESLLFFSMLYTFVQINLCFSFFINSVFNNLCFENVSFERLCSNHYVSVWTPVNPMDLIVLAMPNIHCGQSPGPVISNQIHIESLCILY